MVSLFSKYDTLNKLAYFAFTCGGLMDETDSKWLPILTAYHLIIMHFSVVIAIVELIIGSREVKDVVGTLSIVVSLICAITRAIRFLSRKNDIRNLFNRLEVLRIEMLKDKTNRYSVDEVEIFGRKMLIIVFLSLNCFPLPSFLLATFSDYLMDFKEKQLVLKIWIPWNHEEIWANILTNAVISIMSLSCFSMYVAIYFMDITFTLYISAYIKTLQNNLINKRIRNEGIYEQHKVIIQLINDHNEILSGIKYLETQISPLMPCGFGYVFIRALKKHEISKTLDNCVRTILCLMPSVITCCCGQQIINQMERLHEATYMSKWYEEEPKKRKDLLMMMIKATKPTSINYRLFVTYDHVLLSLVLQTVYSYLMLMANLDAD